MNTLNSFTSLRRACTMLLALLLLFLTANPTAADPAEEAKFPDGYDDLEDAFGPYFSVSTSTLRNLDRWTEGKVDNYDENNWENACADVLGKLHQAYRNALDTYQETNEDADELPDEVMDWYEDEVKAWNNVSSIGYDFIALHDDLVDLTNAIDMEYLREVKSAQENAKNLATILEKGIKLLADMAGTPLPSMPSGLPPEIQKQYDKEVAPAALALQQFMIKVQEDVQWMKDRVAREKYDARLSALQGKDIDPDQSGVFVQHERTWESNLRSALIAFEKAYDTYIDTAQPIYEGTMVVRVQGLKAHGYEYARAAADYFNDLKQQYERMVGDLGPPMAGIDHISIRDFREVGARQNVRVTIKNMGKVTLQPGEWVLTCAIEEHPKHYRPSSKDFACEETLDKELPPGRTHAFSLPFTAPEAAGAWELKWELKHQGDLTDSATEAFMILGEVHAEIDRVKVDGRTSNARLTAGRTVKIEVTVENTGTEFLFKNRCELVARVEESPRDYKAQRKDFAFEITLREDIPPGKTYTFKETVEVPEGIGDWELQFDFKANRKTLDTEIIDVEVEQ